MDQIERLIVVVTLTPVFGAHLFRPLFEPFHPPFPLLFPLQKDRVVADDEPGSVVLSFFARFRVQNEVRRVLFNLGTTAPQLSRFDP